MSEPQNLGAARVLLAEQQEMMREQRSALEALRTRAVALISVGALVAGLFGSTMPRNLSNDVQVFALVAALTAFAATVILGVLVVWPHELRVGVSAEPTLKLMDTGRVVREYDLAVERARGLEGDFDANEKTMRRMYAQFSVACAFVAIEVAAWALVLAA